jgi:trk system potassium uptake protein TrkH
MHTKVIVRVVGLLLMLFSLTLLPPAIIALWTGDGALAAFLTALAITMFMGLMLWLPARNGRQDLRIRDGFVIVVAFWVGLGLTGAIPFVLAEHPHVSLPDAVFESISGLTTTGATVITDIDYLPPSIQYYRQQLQWLGGMGIIVLAVAILPMLGVGGMQLYRAETPGPMKDNKLTPRVTETAKALWLVYLSMTIACALAYWLAGMDLFDAIGHSFSTVAIGGFSTHDASLGFYNNPVIELIAIFFMLAAGINFALHFLAWRTRNPMRYWEAGEFRAYISILSMVSLAVTLYLWHWDAYSFLEAVRYAVFHAVSIGTTTGFATTEFQAWPAFLPILLLFASFVGGCAGSTGGGLKVVRCMLLVKQGGREIRRLIHPNAVIHIRIDGKAMSDRVVDAVWGFFAAYVGAFGLIMLAVMMTGMDQVTAFSAVAACINNLGPGLGAVSAHYGDISDTAKYILSFAMLLGRLEIFTLLVLLTPTFWRA